MSPHLQAVLFVVFFLLSVSAYSASPTQRYLESHEAVSSHFDWSSITPAAKLIYHNCFDDFQCARLLVPLDWQDNKNTFDQESIAIGIIKLPAAVSSTHPSYAGPIFMNPGGPGASGIDFLRVNGRLLQSSIDSNTAHFDIISFDPRGVGVSEPIQSCYSDPFDQALWYLKYEVSSTLNINGSDIRLSWASARAFSLQCSRSGFGKYLSSAYVARDLLHILERETIVSGGLDVRTSCSVQGDCAIGRTDEGDKTPRLQHLGFSYGTFLGATFASMFPERVKRMVLDGVVDAYRQVRHDGLSNVQDTDRVLNLFYEYCYSAGSKCPLFDAGGLNKIKQEVDNILLNLDNEPQAIVDGKGHLPPEILTSKDLKSWIFRSLYHPTTTFSFLADLLSTLKRGHAQQLLRLLRAKKTVSCPPGKAVLLQGASREAHQAYICGDTQDTTNITMAQFLDHLRRLESRSQLAGAVIAEQMMCCTAWMARPAWWFNGSFGSELSSLPPILWMGNKFDPITPTGNAYRMAKHFPNSGVLEQDGIGHCALLNEPSNCTLGVVRDYFAKGMLPSTTMKCPGGQGKFWSLDTETEDGRANSYESLIQPFVFAPRYT